MKKVFFGCGTRDVMTSAGLLVLRLSLGLMMLIGHGIPKLQNFGKIIENGFYTPDFFPLNWMSMQVSLGATIVAEMGAALLIILGLATRPASFLLGFTMAVAAFAVLASKPWFLGPGVTSAKEPALLYLVAMLAIIITGPGRYSLDAIISKERRGRMKIAL